MPIANTVKTREVRAGFRRGQDVIRRKRDFQRRNADFLHRRAKAFERFGSVHDGFSDISGQALAEHFLRQTDAQALHACFHLTVHGRIAAFDGGRVAAIVAGNRVQHKRVVRHSLRHRADLIQRRGKRDQSIAADHAIRRLHANNAAERRGWRMEPPVSLPRENGASSAATHAAEPPDDPPGTCDKSRGLCVG